MATAFLPTFPDTGEIRRRIQNQIPLGQGAGVAIVTGGQVVLAEGFGQTARRGGEPVTSGTLFQIGSVTKSLTSLAILRLRDQGLIDLDAPVQRYLPHFAHADMTVRHLLNQTSGFGMAAWRVGLDNPAIRESEMAAARALGTLPLQTKPGTSWMYANANYITLGAIITAVTGRPSREYMQESLLKPMGMRQSTFDGAQAVRRPYARGYQGRIGFAAEIPMEETPAWGDAAGLNLFASADDLAAYMTYLLRHRSALEEAFEGVTPTILKGFRYGLGWWSTEYLEERLVFVPGQAFGSNAILCLLPERNLGVAVMATLYGDSATTVAMAVLALLLGKDSAPRLLPNMARIMDPFFYGLTGVGAAALGGLALVAGGGLPLWGTAVAAVLSVLLLLLPRAMRRSPVMPFPLPVNVGPGGWPAEVILAWASLLAAALAWTAYGLMA